MINMLNKRFAAWLIIPALLIACQSKKDKQEKSGPASGKGPIPVEGMIIQKENFNESLTLTGSLLASETVNIASEINGRIIKILFQEGQVVSKGQLLIQFNDADIRASLKKAKANLDWTEKDLSRKKELRSAKAISAEELEMAENALQVAQAEKELLESQLEKHSIKAPFSGKMGIRSISPGSIVSPGMPLVKLYQLDPIKIEFSIPEKYSGQLKVNIPFTFTTSASDKSYAGTVRLLDPEIDPSTRTIKVRGTCPNPNHVLSTGSFVSVNLPIYSTSDAVIIPASAVSADINGQKVLLLKEGKVTARYVTTGSRTEDRVLINEGLIPGDTLITAGLLQLKEGSPAELKQTRD
jgi:membrane fusion protein, multidrug efflux system